MGWFFEIGNYMNYVGGGVLYLVVVKIGMFWDIWVCKFFRVYLLKFGDFLLNNR